MAAVCAVPGAAQMLRYYKREGPPPSLATPEPAPAPAPVAPPAAAAPTAAAAAPEVDPAAQQELDTFLTGAI